MREFRINWAVILAFIVLLVYTYISFLGALYIFQSTENPILFSILSAVFQVVLVSALVVVLCISKATRWKWMGRIAQILFGAIILATFLVSGAAFSRFLDASARQNDITAEIENIKETAKQMKVEYRSYVNNRVAEYRSQLPIHYISEYKVQSLKHHLLPASLSQCETSRDEWLDEFGDMSVWNIRMPERLNVLSETVSDWLGAYVELSNFSYSGSVTPFSYEEFDEQLNQLTSELMPEDIFENLHIRWWVFILAIMAVFVMLLPYFITPESETGHTSDDKPVLETIKGWFNNDPNKEPKFLIIERTDLSGKKIKKYYYYE